MGVIKVGCQGPRKDLYVHQLFLKYTDDELVQEDGYLFGDDHNNPNSNLSDTGCELVLVNDQIFNVPYGLYELANLNGILSLETWNSFLTEEERFDLSAYLPDMDKETFEVTLIELLRGDDLYFGSPLEVLFHRLKGGFFSLQVTQLREGLKFLQERGYYHSLRSYHESMSKAFVEMRKAWSNSKLHSTVEERVQIWKDKKKQCPAFLDDLNASLLEELPSKGEKKVLRPPSCKKTTFLNEEIITHFPFTEQNDMILNSRRRAKGVLKLKLPVACSGPKKVSLSLASKTLKPVTGLPKGVLKVKPQGYSSSLVERPKAIAVPHGQRSDSVFGVHKPQVKKIVKKLNNAPRLGGSSYRGSPLPGLVSVKIGSRLSDNEQNSSRKMKIKNALRRLSNDFGECFDCWQKDTLCSTSSGLYQTDHDNNHMKLMSLRTDVSKLISRNLITTDDYEMFPTSNDRSENQFRDMDDRKGVEKSHMFPITYKRKKPHTKLSALKNQRIPSMVASTGPAVPDGSSFNQVEKTRTIRVRMKGWSEFSSQHKQVCLGDQHHGASLL